MAEAERSEEDGQTETAHSSEVRGGRWILVLCVFSLYLGLSYTMSDRYPFSTFAMFSASQSASSTLLVRDGAGQERPVFDFDRFRCDLAPQRRWSQFKGQELSPNAVEETAIAYIRAQAAPEPEAPDGKRGVKIQVFRRVWDSAAAGYPSLDATKDVPVANCTARPAASWRTWTRLAWYFNR